MIRGKQEPLVPHLEDEIAVWAIPSKDGSGHVFVQTVRGTPRCAGMQGNYGVVNKYRPKEPRDRRDGKKEAQQRPLFGVNAISPFATGTRVIESDRPVIPVAARPPFEERWEGKWRS